MSVTYLQTKLQIIRLIDEVSVDGTSTARADTETKIPQLINDALMDLASTTVKIPAVFSFVHNPVCNDLSYDTSSVKLHVPGVDNIYVLQGAKSCFFEVNGHYDVRIEEEINGAWTELERIIPTVFSSQFTEVKRLINPSSTSNNVRLRFTGNYPYSYRNYILYPYSWPSVDEVQQHRPHFLYSLPQDFLKLSNVMVRKDIRQWVPCLDYILIGKTYIGINRYVVGEYQVNYFRTPVLLSDSPNNTDILDIGDDAARVVPYYVAGQLMMQEDAQQGIMLLNQYEAKKAMLVSTDASYVGSQANIYVW